MNTKKFIYPLFSILLLMLIWGTPGCVDDNFDFDKLSTHTENEGNWGGPIVKTSFQLNDLLDIIDTTGYVETDTSGLVMIVYSDTAYSGVAEEEIVFPDREDYDTLFNHQDYVEQGWEMEKQRIPYEFAAVSNFQVLDSIIFKSVEMHVNVTSSFKFEGTLTLTFPELTKNGETYKKIIQINDNSGNFSFSKVFDDLDDYKLNFTEFDQPNNYLINYNLTLHPETGSGEPQPGGECEIDIDMRNIKYNYVWGYIGKQQITIPETNQYIDIFNEVDYGEFQLKDPRLGVRMINSFGIPVNVYMKQLQLKTGTNEEWVDVTGEEIPTEQNPWILPIPEYSYPDIQTADTTVKITGTGTNLDSIVAQLPDNMRFSEIAIINPDDDNTQRNYMSAESRVTAIMELEIPLWGRTTGISFSDTADMDLDIEDEDREMIDYVDLNIRIANGLPHSLGVKAYLMDSLYNILDTIPNANDTPSDSLILVESGNLTFPDGAGPNEVIIDQNNKSVRITNIRYEENGVDVIKDVKYMKYKIRFLTTDGETGDNAPHVKYLENYGMDLNVSADVKLNVNENL